MPVCITFDTERDFYSSQSYTSLGYKDKRFSMLEKAIPRLLKISDEYDIPYTFFLCGEVAENCRDLFSGLRRHSIGVHTHPFTHPDIFKGSNPNDHEFDKLEKYTFNEQYLMIARDFQLITNNLDVKPKVFRAGKHSANLTTFKVLDKLDFLIDCSLHPTFQIIGWQPFQIQRTSVWEIPTYCDLSPELFIHLKRLFRLSAYMHRFTHGVYSGVIHPMLFGNPIINTEILFDRYSKMLEMILSWGFKFLTIEQALEQAENKNRVYNSFGKMIGKAITPIHYMVRKIIQ